jgi:hypothetical protein
MNGSAKSLHIVDLQLSHTRRTIGDGGEDSPYGHTYEKKRKISSMFVRSLFDQGDPSFRLRDNLALEGFVMTFENNVNLEQARRHKAPKDLPD